MSVPFFKIQSLRSTVCVCVSSFLCRHLCTYERNRQRAEHFFFLLSQNFHIITTLICNCCHISNVVLHQRVRESSCDLVPIRCFPLFRSPTIRVCVRERERERKRPLKIFVIVRVPTCRSSEHGIVQSDSQNGRRDVDLYVSSLKQRQRCEKRRVTEMRTQDLQLMFHCLFLFL